MTSSHGRLTWFGHATVVVETARGVRICIDPWLEGNPLLPPGLGIDSCDAILLTHGHSDHSADALALSHKTGAQVIGHVELVHWLTQLGLENGNGMNKGGTINVGGVRVTMVNAHHSSSIEVGGRLEYAGEPAGYVLELESGYTIYDAGDTCLFGDMRLIGEVYRPDLAILPIGDHYTMGPREAAHAIRLVGAQRVLPVHYGTFPVLAGTPEKVAEAHGHLGEGVLCALKPGERLEL